MHSGAALARLIDRSKAPGDPVCELCGAPLAASHRHVLDLPADELQCACRACVLLFDREAAARGHYRLVPQRRLRLTSYQPDVGTPVGLAFYVIQPDGSVVVRYPGPAGATSGLVDPDAWTALLQCWPELSGLTPSVEALLINAVGSSREHWIVPLDDCYRLIAVIREHWTGLSGGRAVWPAVDEFFAGLAPSARRVATSGRG